MIVLEIVKKIVEYVNARKRYADKTNPQPLKNDLDRFAGSVGEKIKFNSVNYGTGNDAVMKIWLDVVGVKNPIHIVKGKTKIGFNQDTNQKLNRKDKYVDSYRIYMTNGVDNNKKNEKDYREKEADVWLCAFHNEEDDVVKIFTDIWDYIAVNEANRYFSKNFSGKRSIASYFNPSSYIGKPKTIQKKHLICKRDEDELAYIEAVKKYDEAFEIGRAHV